MPLTQRAITLAVACIVGLSCGTNYVYRYFGRLDCFAELH
jgi:hypothetical protein